MILFSAGAILASSNSKSGPGVPLIEREDLRSSNDSTISKSVIHSIVSVGNCEQARTSVLNRIFQEANVVGVGNLSWSSEIVGRLLHPLKIFTPWGRTNFWPTVLTGISDPRLCLVFDVHSLHAVMCLPLR